MLITGPPVSSAKATRRSSAAQATLVLVAGPNVPEALVRRHCVCALTAGHTVALVLLRRATIAERYLLVALRSHFGSDSIWLVHDHRDWRRVPEGAPTVVQSDQGLWSGDARVADRETAEHMDWEGTYDLYRRLDSARAR
ncbi:hypothetical protein LLS1_00610 [Leifsonia sp. LS1]|uniref:hypothetical protein n=1 Tax=Leifsonia sp. LS1 TaxID=2828483 RepID=UPI001CFCAE39|nr:hypothetical protein [Leifsonia sp. LS1]GIT78392.1 hypothetical protein LLS1_00610 [Leifsonia sp. LS1]